MSEETTREQYHPSRKRKRRRSAFKSTTKESAGRLPMVAQQRRPLFCVVSIMMIYATTTTTHTAHALTSVGRKAHTGVFTTTSLRALDSRELRFFHSKSTTSRSSNSTASSRSLFPSILAQQRSFAYDAIALVTGVGNDMMSLSSTPKQNRLLSSSLSESLTPPDGEFVPKRGYGPYIALSAEERQLFTLLRKAREEAGLTTTLRVAGGWVRDKLLATPEFARSASSTGGRLTSKYKQGSMGRQGTKVIGNDGKNTDDDDDNQPVDIDVALDDMLGREFADSLNEYLARVGEETHTVGVVLKNPEKSKHLETATMKVGTFWIDFVNLRAEEYTQDSRIPDLMRIGSPAEDAFRRDLTINALFYNINNGQVEDWTGRGFDDLRKGVVTTPLAPLTTLLDDPLRALRSVRFAARLRFTMDDSLVVAAMDSRVRKSLAEKVSRERVGGEVDLMLRSPDPVGAMRLLINLNLVRTVFTIDNCFAKGSHVPNEGIFTKGLDLLSTTHDHLMDCKVFPPSWCQEQTSCTTHGTSDLRLSEDEERRRLLWYAAFLKPLYDDAKQVAEVKKSRRQGSKKNRSTICRLLVDELKRPTREADAVEKIMEGANHFSKLMKSGCDISAISILLSDIKVQSPRNGDQRDSSKLACTMNGNIVRAATEEDPVWQHAMEFRLLCSNVMREVGPLWRASLFLSLSEQMADTLQDDLDYVIEGDMMDETQDMLREAEVEKYDAFASAMRRIGLIGIWEEKKLLDGKRIKDILPGIPKGPAFRDVMLEQEQWVTLHPGAGSECLVRHLAAKFPDFT